MAVINGSKFQTGNPVNDAAIRELLALINANKPGNIKKIILMADTELTISGGIITVGQSFHSVDTEGDGASDDLDTINGGVEGMIIYLKASNTARSVVIKNGTGNIVCGTDCTMDNVNDTWSGIYDGSNWLELSRADNGA